MAAASDPSPPYSAPSVLSPTPQVERSFTDTDKHGHEVTLNLLCRGQKTTHLPGVLEGDDMKGTVILNLAKPYAAKTIAIAVLSKHC